MKYAIYLSNLKKLAKTTFKFVSSGEERKSSSTAGAINAYGFPLIRMITLPCIRYFAHLSGLSVDINCGIP